jgi:hypothetical protein
MLLFNISNGQILKTISIRSGLHYDIVNITENHNNSFKQRLDGLSPSFELVYSQMNQKKFVYGLSLYYSDFGHNIGIEGFNSGQGYHGPFFDMYKTLKISFNAGYCIVSKKKLKIKYITGLSGCYNFHNVVGTVESLYSNPFTGHNQFLRLTIDSGSFLSDYNILLKNALEISYITKRNINYSIFCSYNTGLVETWHEKAYYAVDDATEVYEPSITSRGSSFNFGIGIGYVFQANKD